MKTILLWDPRFPNRKPARLTLDDALASAAVRSGVAAAANPSEAGVLGAGPPLDAGLLTEVVVQHGANGGGLTRVLLPFSVALVGAAAGVLASVGTPITGPAPSVPGAPTLTVTRGDGRLTLGWTDNNISGSPITEHRLYASSNDDAVVFVGTIATASPYVDLALVNGVKRNYQLSAVNANGEGPRSDLKSEIPTAATFAATFANPRVAIWDSSRGRQATCPSGSVGVHKTFGGIMGFVESKLPQIVYPLWREDNLPQQNAAQSKSDGFVFAADGNSFANMRSRRPKMIASDADIFISTLTSNSIQLTNEDGTSFTTQSYFVNSYVNGATTTFAPVLAANKRIIVQNCWERASTNPNAPPQWKDGDQRRAAIESINVTYANSIANTPGIELADIRSNLVDLTGTTHDPLPGITRDGDAHFSQIGSWLAAKPVIEKLKARITGVAKGVDAYRTSPNLFPNPTLAGSNAINGVTGVTGFVPDNISVARTAGGGTAGSATIAIVQVNGRNVIRVTPDSTAMAANTFEGVTLTISGLPALAAASWYQACLAVKPGAWDAWRNVGQVSLSGSGFNVYAHSPTNTSNTPLSSLSTGNPMPMPAEDMGELVAITPYGRSNAAAASGLSFSVWWTKGSPAQSASIDLYLPELHQTIDPHLFLFDETKTAAAQITSAANPTFPGDGTTTPTVQLSANQPGYWSVVPAASGGGADAGLWSVSTAGVATRSSPFNYQSPNDADGDRVDQVTFMLTPTNPALAPTTLAMTLTATYVDQGFKDDFNRANETLAASANWTKVGAGTQTISVGNNKLNANGGSGNVAYMSPQQGDTTDQEVGIQVAASSSLYHPVVTIAMKDEKNWVGMRFSTANRVIVTQCNGGTTSGVFSCDMFAPYDTGGVSSFAGLLINNVIYVYQAGVLIGFGAYDMSAKADWKRSGFNQYTSSAATGGFDNYTNKVGVLRASKVGLRNLTVASTTGAVGSDYASAFNDNTKTQDSDVSITYTGGVADVNWFVDGQVLRGVSPPAGRYVLTLSERFPGAVLNGRQSTITIDIA